MRAAYHQNMSRSWKKTILLIVLAASVPLRALAGGGMILCDARSEQQAVGAAVATAAADHRHSSPEGAHTHDHSAHGHEAVAESAPQAAADHTASHEHGAQPMDDKSCDLCGLCHLLCAPAMVHTIAAFEDHFSHVLLSRAVPHALSIVPPRAERPPLA